MFDSEDFDRVYERLSESLHPVADDMSMVSKAIAGVDDSTYADRWNHVLMGAFDGLGRFELLTLWKEVGSPFRRSGSRGTLTQDDIVGECVKALSLGTGRASALACNLVEHPSCPFQIKINVATMKPGAVYYMTEEELRFHVCDDYVGDEPVEVGQDGICDNPSMRVIGQFPDTLENACNRTTVAPGFYVVRKIVSEGQEGYALFHVGDSTNKERP